MLSLTAASTADLIFGCALRMAEAAPTSDDYLFFLRDSSGGANNAILAVEGDTVADRGKVYLIDAAGATAISASAPFSSCSWHYVELYCVDADAGSCEVFVDGSSVLSDSGDYLSIARTAVVGWGDNSAGSTNARDFDDCYVNLDPSGDAADRLATSNQLPEVFAYQCARGATCTANGSALDVGTWDMAGDQPVNSAAGNVAEYTGTPLAGEVEMDSGARAGPSGDSNIDGAANIKGANWWFYMQRSGGGGTTHTLRFGNSVDAVTSEATTIGTSIAGFRKVSTGSAVPTNAEYCAMGMGVSGAQDLTGGEFYCYILHLPNAPVAGARSRAIYLGGGR